MPFCVHADTAIVLPMVNSVEKLATATAVRITWSLLKIGPRQLRYVCTSSSLYLLINGGILQSQQMAAKVPRVNGKVVVSKIEW